MMLETKTGFFTEGMAKTAAEKFDGTAVCIDGQKYAVILERMPTEHPDALLSLKCDIASEVGGIGDDTDERDISILEMRPLGSDTFTLILY